MLLFVNAFPWPFFDSQPLLVLSLQVGGRMGAYTHTKTMSKYFRELKQDRQSEEQTEEILSIEEHYQFDISLGVLPQAVHVALMKCILFCITLVSFVTQFEKLSC